MTADAEEMRLRTLLRVREVERDSARRSLGEALADEDRAREASAAAEAAILAETRLAVHSADDHGVERFARWLTRGRAELRARQTALAEAAVQTSHKRAELALLHAAADATAQALASCLAYQADVGARVAQAELDELGQQRWQQHHRDA